MLGSKRILVGEHILSLASETTPPYPLVGEILTLPGSQLVGQGAELRNFSMPIAAATIQVLQCEFPLWLINIEYPCILIKFPFHSANIHMVSHNFPVLLLLESEFGLININVF